MGLVLFLVVFSAVFVAFTDEITKGLKRLFSVTWVRVLVPMVLASFLWVWFDEEVLSILAYFQANLAWFTVKFTSMLPHKITLFTGRVLSVYLPASLPAWLLYWKMTHVRSCEAKINRVSKLYVLSWLFFFILVVA
ncbi:MAG: hypothetical protein GW760_05105 [Legionella sp.]|nr:hypothetical protein [Legionella sp.]